MNVIIDTNVVLDALTGREPFADASTEAIALASDAQYQRFRRIANRSD